TARGGQAGDRSEGPIRGRRHRADGERVGPGLQPSRPLLAVRGLRLCDASSTACAGARSVREAHRQSERGRGDPPNRNPKGSGRGGGMSQRRQEEDRKKREKEKRAIARRHKQVHHAMEALGLLEAYNNLPDQFKQLVLENVLPTPQVIITP